MICLPSPPRRGGGNLVEEVEEDAAVGHLLGELQLLDGHLADRERGALRRRLAVPWRRAMGGGSECWAVFVYVSKMENNGNNKRPRAYPPLLFCDSRTDQSGTWTTAILIGGRNIDNSFNHECKFC